MTFRNGTLVTLALWCLAGIATAQSPGNSPLPGPFTEVEADSGNVGRWYQVEVILFERLDGSHREETWPTFPNLSGTAEAHILQAVASGPGPAFTLQPADLANPPSESAATWPVRDPVSGKERPFVAVPEAELTLTDAAARLDGSRNRRVLLHTGWHMPVQGAAAPDLVRLTVPGALNGRALVDGTLSIHVGRFLHVGARLYATRYELTTTPLRAFFADRPAPPVRPDMSAPGPWHPALRYRGVGDLIKTPQWVPVESIAFRETRRLRSNEIHYIDHPYFGLIVRFTPYTPVHLQEPDNAQPAGPETVD